MKHIKEHPGYEEIRGIIDRERLGITCTEDESATIKRWIKDTMLMPDNGSIDLDSELQIWLPCEYSEAQQEIDEVNLTPVNEGQQEFKKGQKLYHH